uniref:Uncharacterized protein n=1 Tax=Anopheles christyi TaxID=43041 RepID=A0A182JWW0_9DIPT
MCRQKGECPFSARSINFYNYAFPQDVIALVMPRGLWKALVTGRRNGVEKTDIMWMDLRVRKYNRTSTVLNGTIHLYQEGTNQYQLDLFYSRLGNQQFNHMPIKLPMAGICDFINNLHDNYAKHLHLVVNFPGRGECPIKIREMYIFDTETPAEIIPQGLIKIAMHICSLQFHLDIFYSRLGNQQYNHLPVKLPAAGTCNFWDNLHASYPKYLILLVNVPEQGKCPITPREIHLYDVEFPNDAAPTRMVKEGMYKALIRGYHNGKEIINYSIVLKAVES